MLKRLIFSALLLTTACEPIDNLSDISNPESNSMGKFMGSGAHDPNEASYAKVLPQTPIVFPEDHQAHNDYRIEWWYLTANLTTEQGESLGLQWTQFRVATATSPAPERESVNAPSPNAWATEQLYLAHSAVTTQKQHLASERWSRGHPQLAGVASSPLRVFIDDWQWRSASNDLFPATLNGRDEAFSYQLQLNSQAPYQLQGTNGYSIKSADGTVASHYYSQPFIDVSGEVTIEGKVVPVTGQAWLDREWSSQFLTQGQQGWDWFALRLNQDTALMLFQLRGDGSEQAHFYAGRLMHRDGQGESLTSSDIKVTALETHDIDGKTIPVAWQVEVAKHQIDVTVSALNTNALMPLSIRYWEGPVTLTGTHQGVGYMELTGY
ncbi:carotenoid 1,2-hydratase [Shewanella sp. SNU WT4]|uniref:lipocalin-like domain-containing protein n=1 Tax=Shewanella sp. SNU WT4 TaxID=2590015 RepID=UPI001129083C|nr:lipocalin-like domain-containing protein [Shewanella sp. SNU WT4]QDF68208.1 carotenoid 1,2-hydratase [Shewanella sp. SNU WT4]